MAQWKKWDIMLRAGFSKVFSSCFSPVFSPFQSTEIKEFEIDIGRSTKKVEPIEHRSSPIVVSNSLKKQDAYQIDTNDLTFFCHQPADLFFCAMVSPSTNVSSCNLGRSSVKKGCNIQTSKSDWLIALIFSTDWCLLIDNPSLQWCFCQA